MMRFAFLVTAAFFAGSVFAQDHSQHGQGHASHSQHSETADETRSEPQRLRLPTPQSQQVVPLPGSEPEPVDHSTMDHSAMDHDMSAPVENAEAPLRAFEGPQYAADAIYGAETMARARRYNHATHGDMKTGMLMVERLEARLSDGEDAYLWDAQGWYGGDIDKFVVKTEGEGEFGGSIEDAEVQALWGHAIGPYFDLQAGARFDFEPETRSHLVVGVQGLAPYMFHTDFAAFLSDRGDLTARLEGEYDYKLTQRLILQPRAELELSAQHVAERELGSGLTKIETGLRLRYEFAREFAPYVGVGYEAKTGETAEIARSQGEDPDGFALLFGVRAWF